MIKVNVGCGTTIAEDWVNIDNSFNIILSRIPPLKIILLKMKLINQSIYKNWPKNIIKHDVTKGLPFKNCSVDFVYSSHFIEHITREQTIQLIAECYRVLKYNGVMRIVIPDLKKISQSYVQNTIDADTFLESLHIIPNSKNTIYAEKFFPWLFTKDKHKWMYDFESLSKILIKVGFEKVTLTDYKQGVVPDIQKLDNRAGDSLFLEVKKTICP